MSGHCSWLNYLKEHGFLSTFRECLVVEISPEALLPTSSGPWDRPCKVTCMDLVAFPFMGMTVCVVWWSVRPRCSGLSSCAPVRFCFGTWSCILVIWPVKWTGLGWNSGIVTATKALWIRLFPQQGLWCKALVQGLELAVALLHVLGPERAQHRPCLF